MNSFTNSTGNIGIYYSDRTGAPISVPYAGNPYNLTTTSYPTWESIDIINEPLKNLNSIVNFEEDKNNRLSKNIKGIRKKRINFNCIYDGNRIQPYEYIMNLIEQKKKFKVSIKVSNILTINYINFQFVKIENNLSFNNGNCDFSELRVKFKYDKILYQNEKLSEKELRTDKLKKIMNYDESNNN